VQGLQRIDQNTGDVAAALEHAKRRIVHVAQGVGPALGHRIADPRLNLAPPTMVGAAEADQLASARVIPGQAHGLHHRLGPRHVKRDFVHARNLEQPAHVVGDDRVVAAEHRSELPDALAAAGDAVLVEVVPEDVDAVRAGNVIELVAVHIGQGHAGGGRYERAALEMPAHEAAELIGNAVTAGELEIGDGVEDARCEGGVRRTARGESRRQAHEARSAGLGDTLGRVVHPKDPLLAILVVRDETGEAARHARMTGDRPVLGSRQLQPSPEFGQRGDQHTGRSYPDDRRIGHLKPPRGLYCRRVTLT
jgi:hypothetical protein